MIIAKDNDFTYDDEPNWEPISWGRLLAAIVLCVSFAAAICAWRWTSPAPLQVIFYNPAPSISSGEFQPPPRERRILCMDFDQYRLRIMPRLTTECIQMVRDEIKATK